MRKVLVAIILFSILFSGKAFAQWVCDAQSPNATNDESTYMSMSAVGCAPNSGGYIYNNPAHAGMIFGDNMALYNPGTGTTCIVSTQNNPALTSTCGVDVAPVAGAIWEVRVRDGDGAALADVVPSTVANIATTLQSLLVSNLMRAYDPTGGVVAWLPVYMNSALADDEAPANTIEVSDFSYTYDVANNNWDRTTRRASADNLSATSIGVDVLNYNHFYDNNCGGAPCYRRWYGALIVDNLGTPSVPWVGSFLEGYDVTNDHWDRVQVDPAGNLTVNQLTSFPGYGRIQDGDSTVVADVEDANADGKSLGLNPLMTAATMYLYNGATLDMARSGAVRELQMTDVATRPGEDAANDWRKVKKQEIAVYTPAKETSGAIAAAAVVVMASKEVVSWPNCCLYYRNLDNTDPLTDAAVYTSSDNAGTCGDANWASLTWVACDGLTTGQTCVYCFSAMSYRYICGTATATAPNPVSSLDAWLVCNKG